MNAARSHLAALAAAPRPAGGAAESTAREYCSATLRAAGFDVRHREFEYSAFPGRWGTPIFGVCVAALMLAAAREGAAGRGSWALGMLVGGAAALAVSGRWLARRGVLDLPFARARATNLQAMRGAPTLWLMAHLDSKSQPIPIVVRALAIIASMVSLGVAMGVGAAQLVIPMPPFVWYALAAIGVLAALPVMASVVGARSAGALDNASGVATVLRVAELLPRDIAIGVLLTSGEELGLAGARAWARGAPPASAINVAPPSAINVAPLSAINVAPLSAINVAPLSALNIDGVDDTGAHRLIYSGRLPSALIALLGSAWPTPRRLVPGVLMDGVALSEAGWNVVNISKGSWRTVSRIHTPRDDLAHLDGSGAEEVATLLAGAIKASLH